MDSRYLLAVALNINPLTRSHAGRNRPWQALAFLPLLTSSLLTKICIIYAQLLQEEKIFPVMPRSEWSAEWSLKYAQNAQNVEQKTQTKICYHYTWLLHGKSRPSRWHFLRSFLTASKPSRRPITAAIKVAMSHSTWKMYHFINSDNFDATNLRF